MATAEQTTGLDAVVAGNVRALRARQRLRQEDLAERLGWARASLASLEGQHRRVTLADAVALCQALGVTLGGLLDGAERETLAVLGVYSPAEVERTAAVYASALSADSVERLAEILDTGVLPIASSGAIIAEILRQRGV